MQQPLSALQTSPIPEVQAAIDSLRLAGVLDDDIQVQYSDTRVDHWHPAPWNQYPGDNYGSGEESFAVEIKFRVRRRIEI